MLRAMRDGSKSKLRAADARRQHGLSWCTAALLTSCAVLGCIPEREVVATEMRGEDVREDAEYDSNRDAPLLGGTLLVTRSGQLAVAADPDRDKVFIVDMNTEQVTTVALQVNDRPGRVVEGPDGIVFVIARGPNALVRVDSDNGGVTRRDQLCAAPSGIAYDAEQHQVVVACRSGQLVSIDPNTLETVRELVLDDDLRDVVVQGDELVVTRFATTQVIVVDATGAPKRLGTLAAERADFAANSGFRAVAVPSGGVAVVHQQSTTAMLPGGGGPGGTGHQYQGGASCVGTLVQPAITVVAPSVANASEANLLGSATAATLQLNTQQLGSATGPLDVAFSRDGSKVALVAMGNIWAQSEPSSRPTLYILDTVLGQAASSPSTSACSEMPNAYRAFGQPVAVAFGEGGQYVVQSRQPAALEFADGRVVQLSDEAHESSALQLFYRNNGFGVSCASCHPEGEEDGHAWLFQAFGVRRTQTLVGGLSQRAPFHWAGELDSFDALVDDVMVARMGFTSPSEADVGRLLSWLDRLPVANMAPALEPEAVERGRALFNDSSLACNTCHSGQTYSDGLLYDVDTGGSFVTPSLIGVGLRAPFMHDGCAATLEDRFSSCGGADEHGIVSTLSEPQLDDLVAFLRSL